jgi:A/G-specific adenine glycosylase
MPTVPTIPQFRDMVFDYYYAHGRSALPWRQPLVDGNFDPYKILVSELMLQQTQVNRVIPKYIAFLQKFPTLDMLSMSSQGDVLRAWSGLGYNRRAKFLQQAASIIQQKYNGVFPQTIAELATLPGVGVNTAGAIMAYAFDQPVTFIETNIRTVFIHSFFVNQEAISDRAIAEVVQASLPTENFREWYWALMDYGAYLKAQGLNLTR